MLFGVLFIIATMSFIQVHRLAVDEESQTSRTITNDDWQVYCLLEHLDFALLYG